MLQKAADSLGWELSQREAGQDSFSDQDLISPLGRRGHSSYAEAGVLSGREDGRNDSSGSPPGRRGGHFAPLIRKSSPAVKKTAGLGPAVFL
jgi:hypothetical protein